MLLANRPVRLLFDAAPAFELTADELVRPLGLDAAALTVEGGTVEWATYVAIVDEISRQLGNDPARLRAFGRQMTRLAAPYDPLRRAARGMVSARELYEFADRWIVHAAFPHLRMFMRFVGKRMYLHAEIPDPHLPCEAFFHLYEGRIASLPEMIGLPPARALERRIGPRTADHVFEVPEVTSLAGRLRRFPRKLFASSAAAAAIEEQREEFTASLDALRHAREEIRAVLDRLPDYVLVHVGGTIAWANRSLVARLGYQDADALRGTPLLDIVVPRSRPVAAERMSLPPDMPGLPRLTEASLKARSGEEVVVEVAPTQAVAFDGVPARLLVGRDVTERARMQDELFLADRLASVGLLAAGVAHEVNNPLAYVLNNIEMAQKELAGLDADVDADLAVALEGVARIRATVRELLELSRGSRASAPEDRLDLRSVVASTLALAAREIDRTARLREDIGPCPAVRGSEPRIAQLLLNLISHALEGMRGQPRERSELLVRLAGAPDGRLLLEVSDTREPRVDEPGASLLDRGLGLIVAKQLVTEVGGEIAFFRGRTGGATSRVLLPPAEA